MNLYVSKTLYDNAKGVWVEKYFINDCEVEEDEYYFRLDKEQQKMQEQEQQAKSAKQSKTKAVAEDKEGEACCGVCCCACCETYVIDFEIYDILDEYIECIMNVAPCEHCVKEVLIDFIDEIFDYIEYFEEDEN